MCDTFVRVLPDRVLFAKNSDRDPNEAQLLEWHARRTHESGARVRCTWIEIDEARETHAVVLSRPFWMWGAEIGANEHGVTIGNEAVFTDQPYAPSGLTGMDLLRLALERAESAERAVAVIGELLETHGQGGGCGHENRAFTYHNSYLVADTRGAFVLETADKNWRAVRIGGAYAISNALTLPELAREHADPVRGRLTAADTRRACTLAAAQRAESLADLAAALRSHGPDAGDSPRYRWHNGGLNAPCVHAGGRLAASQTTASWIAELSPRGVRHFATATAAPCTSLFKPVRVSEPLDLGAAPEDRFDASTLWWRHERLHRAVSRDPTRLLPLFADERDELEAGWFASGAKIEPSAAFAEGERHLAAWTARVLDAAATAPRDARPGFVQRYWAKRDARARMPA
ncbi:MAG: C69 family dipeptidase [Deltaproteobacteria bacterium]|nr:C69 family dipeptidase [Deltaproteobacteria bacterium]